MLITSTAETTSSKWSDTSEVIIIEWQDVTLEN